MKGDKGAVAEADRLEPDSWARLARLARRRPEREDALHYYVARASAAPSADADALILILPLPLPLPLPHASAHPTFSQPFMASKHLSRTSMRCFCLLSVSLYSPLARLVFSS